MQRRERQVSVMERKCPSEPQEPGSILHNYEVCEPNFTKALWNPDGLSVKPRLLHLCCWRVCMGIRDSVHKAVVTVPEGVWFTTLWQLLGELPQPKHMVWCDTPRETCFWGSHNWKGNTIKAKAKMSRWEGVAGLQYTGVGENTARRGCEQGTG